MGMWDWFRQRRRSHRQTVISNYHQSTTIHADTSNTHWPFTFFFANTRGSTQDGFGFSMMQSCPQPKCLSRLACSQILYGGRVEDFSPDCWLENHLHRFGGQPANSFAMPDLETADDSITGSSETDNTVDEYSERSAGTLSDLDSTIFLERPRLPIEDLFMSPEDRDAVIDSPSGYRQVVEPPPYGEFPNEPPPTYAEAVGNEYDSGSISARSSSNESTFLW